jgi:hypothetical protein
MRGTTRIRVRPVKLALMVDPNNTSQVREAIRLACSLWGGEYFPIITVHKRAPSSWRDGPLKVPDPADVVKGYLQGFDPDFIIQFGKDLPQYILDLRIDVVTATEFWTSRSETKSTDPTHGIGVLQVLVDIYNKNFKFKAKYPVSVTIPVLPRTFTLFWASMFGEYPSHISSAIERDFADPLEITKPLVRESDFVELTDGQTLFPRRIAGWATLAEGRRRVQDTRSIFFMDASSTDDVVDFWNLRASGRIVLPLPRQFAGQESFKNAISEFLDRHAKDAESNQENLDGVTFIKSRRCATEEMKAFVSELDSSTPRGSTRIRRKALQHWYPRLWDEWARTADGGIADVYGEDETSTQIVDDLEQSIRVMPVIPAFARGGWFSGHSMCANEVDMSLFGAARHIPQVYPRIEGESLLQTLAGPAFWHREWRVGRHGLVKLVRDSYPENRQLPDSEDIFFSWLKDRGWTAKLSSAGILAKQIFRQMDGEIFLLRDKDVLGLIEHMNGGLVTRDGIQRDETVVSERERSVTEIKKKLNVNRHELFLKMGVFKLGLRTKCPTCQRNSWYAMPSLGEMLDCPKCLIKFPAAGNIDQPNNSGWFYRTAGPFSVPNFADGAFSVLLTLETLAGRYTSRRSTSVLSFEATSPNQANLEADLAMFWRDTGSGEDMSGVLFGECKTYGLFKEKDFQRMQSLANHFPGAILVFSTLRASLTEEEVSSLKLLAKRGRKYWKLERPLNPLLILTGAEVLGWESPPQCWDEERRARFPHLHSLLDLCNATQQIYLGLKPWQEDWHLDRLLRKRPKKTG